MMYMLNGATVVRAKEDEEGRERWATMMADIEGRTVDRTKYRDTIISTVFLGMDYGKTEEGAPLVFETLIMGGKLDGQQVRYPTKDEAQIGHEVMVDEVIQSYGEDDGQNR